MLVIVEDKPDDKIYFDILKGILEDNPEFLKPYSFFEEKEGAICIEESNKSNYVIYKLDNGVREVLSNCYYGGPLICTTFIGCITTSPLQRKQLEKIFDKEAEKLDKNKASIVNHEDHQYDQLRKLIESKILEDEYCIDGEKEGALCIKKDGLLYKVFYLRGDRKQVLDSSESLYVACRKFIDYLVKDYKLHESIINEMMSTVSLSKEPAKVSTSKDEIEILEEVLSEFVDHRLYCIGSECEETMCMMFEDGHFNIFCYERGHRHNVVSAYSKEDACYIFLTSLSESAKEEQKMINKYTELYNKYTV